MNEICNACKTTFMQEYVYSAWLGVGGGVHFHTHTHTVRYTELCMHAHTVRTLTLFYFILTMSSNHMGDLSL